MHLVRGTETIKTIKDNGFSHDIFEMKSKYIDKFNFDYIGEYLNKDRDIENKETSDSDCLPEENLDHYEGHSFEEYDEYLTNLYTGDFEYEDDQLFNFLGEEIFISDSIYEPISVYYKNGKIKYILNSKFDLYRCDDCNCLFLDYENFYSNNKSQNVRKGNDYCQSCYAIALKRFKQKLIRKALSKLSDNNGIKISKQQKYISKVLNGKTNIQIGNFFADIVLGDSNIVVEYDGSGHWMQTVFDKNISKNDVDKRDRLRDKYLNKKGYKVIRFVSEKDLLPSDKEIRKLFKKALNLFDKGESRVVFDLLKLYQDCNLRKITNKDLQEV